MYRFYFFRSLYAEFGLYAFWCFRSVFLGFRRRMGCISLMDRDLDGGFLLGFRGDADACARACCPGMPEGFSLPGFPLDAGISWKYPFSPLPPVSSLSHSPIFIPFTLFFPESVF